MDLLQTRVIESARPHPLPDTQLLLRGLGEDSGPVISEIEPGKQPRPGPEEEGVLRRARAAVPSKRRPGRSIPAPAPASPATLRPARSRPCAQAPKRLLNSARDAPRPRSSRLPVYLRVRSESGGDARPRPGAGQRPRPSDLRTPAALRAPPPGAVRAGAAARNARLSARGAGRATCRPDCAPSCALIEAARENPGVRKGVSAPDTGPRAARTRADRPHLHLTHTCRSPAAATAAPPRLRPSPPLAPAAAGRKGRGRCPGPRARAVLCLLLWAGPGPRSARRSARRSWAPEFGGSRSHCSPL